MSLIAFEPEIQETPLGGTDNRYTATFETTDHKSSGTIKRVLDSLDPNLTRVFLPWALRHPKYLGALGRLARAYKRSAKVRLENRRQGLVVPPFLIISITPRCNLRCVGCYAAAAGTISKNCSSASQPLDLDQWQKIISEATDLGVFGFIIAGGEPFLYPGLLDIVERNKKHLFIIFTNGTAVNEKDLKRLKRLPNAAVIVSIEGDRQITDARRGQGVYDRALRTLQQLGDHGVLTGVSATITRLNYEYWMDAERLEWFIDHGVRLGFFIEYIPTTPYGGSPGAREPGSTSDEQRTTNDEILHSCSSKRCTGLTDAIFGGLGTDANDHALMLTPDERARFRAQVLRYREEKNIYVIHSPGDEDFFGGCVSAGRGFAHITPSGDLTPCPVSNIAMHNITKASLREALASELFALIRENEHLLENGDGPCALFAHPNEVDALAHSVGAYRTGGVGSR